jgi:hypothetical protein
MLKGARAAQNQKLVLHMAVGFIQWLGESWRRDDGLVLFDRFGLQPKTRGQDRIILIFFSL